MSRLCVFVLLMLLAACTAGQAPPDSDNRSADHNGIEVSAQTDRTVAALDESIRFTLSVTCPPHVQVQMPEIGSRIAGLRIVDFGETGPSLIDNRLVFKKWFDLRADSLGSYIIPAMTVRAADHDETREITTPQIFIKVGALSSRPDNETMQDILDIKPPAAVARDWRPLIAGCAIAAGLLAAGLAFWLYRRRRRAAAAPAASRPAHVLALEQLDQLERERLIEKGAVQEHYVRLSDIFRHYLENRFRIPAVEQTTQELLRALRGLADISAAVRNSTRDFLLHADLVKFAKYRPQPHEIQHSRDQVREIIDQTRQDLAAEGAQPHIAITQGDVRP